MKKITFILLTLSLCAVIFLPGNVSASELAVGGTTWYSWWDFHNITDGDREVDPTLLYGPAVSLKFSDNNNLTFVFLYGKFTMDNGENDKDEISRIDSDLALNYRISSSFKLFAGIKYMSYDFPGFYHRSAGPGLGISTALPLTGNIYLLGNISGIYLRGKEKSGESSSDYNEAGGNTGISLAYYIAPASTTISLGGRYQIFRTFYESSDTQFSDNIHQFYGITLSATYSFNL